MKLIQLISYFRSGGTFEGFCKAQALNAEAEVIEIYAQKPVSLDSQLGFFPIEETQGHVEFEFEGLQYQNLFDFFYFLDVIDDIKGNLLPGDVELAQNLLSYALKDA
jgi:hypothetical protein